MPSYSLLRQGDRLPSVGVLQKLLNRTGATLKVDGIFGPRTREAVVTFQRARRMVPDGVVGENTWSRLVFSDWLPILDCVDVFDKDLYEWDAQNIIRAGGNPVLIGGMSRGVLQATHEIVARGRSVFLLRFIGHGRSGRQGVSVGMGGVVGDQRAVLHYRNAANVGTLRLQSVFGPYGNVELHGCNVAAGARGRQFVTSLARSIGVPVSAGTAKQMATFRFDGPTFTAFPGEQTLGSWCASLPDFVPMSVP